MHDHRVSSSRWWVKIDSKNMLASHKTLNLEWIEESAEDNESACLLMDFFEEDDSGHLLVPIKFSVCPVCEGRGRHANPVVDGHGITGEEFEEDPGFRDDYMNGVYDVECVLCAGERVIPVVDARSTPKEFKEIYAEYLREDAMYKAACRAERMMGA